MKRKTDQKFIDIVEGEAGNLLDRCPSLKAALDKVKTERQLRVGLFDAVRVVKQLEGVVNHLLRPATLACLRGLAAGTEFDRRWAAARGVLAWLCVLAVKPEWVVQAEQSTGDCLEFEIETALGVQILSARYQQTRVTLPAQAGGVADFPGEHVFGAPLGGGLDPNAEVDKLVLEIWRRVFPEDSRSALSPLDEKILDAQLNVRRMNGTHNHFLPFSPHQGTPLNDRQFVAILLNKLPHLVIIRLKASSGNCPLLAANEAVLLASVTSFLAIPTELSANP